MAPAPARPGRTVLFGLAWALTTLLALFAGSIILALWLAANAGLAAAQAARSWKRDRGGRQPFAPAAAAGSAFIVLGAGFGLIGLALAAVVGVIGVLAWVSAAPSAHDRLLTLACAVIPAVAAGSPVLLRATDGLVPPLVLLVYAAVYDTAAFVMGAGARWRWEGPLAGIACIGTVTVASAAIFPQFKGLSPWELGALAGALTPLGPVVASRILGYRWARVPALRRLDSLTVLGPLWAVAAAALVS